MCCESMEQFILGFGTSSMSAILMVCCFGVTEVGARSSATSRGKCLVPYFHSTRKPRRAEYLHLLEKPRCLESRPTQEFKSNASTCNCDISAVPRYFFPQKHMRIVPLHVDNSMICRRTVGGIYSFHTNTDEMEGSDVSIIT